MIAYSLLRQEASASNETEPVSCSADETPAVKKKAPPLSLGQKIGLTRVRITSKKGLFKGGKNQNL